MATESLKERLLGDHEMAEDGIPPSSSPEAVDSSGREFDDARSWVVEELTLQFRIAGPMILVNILQYSLLVISYMFVGHLGRLALASASIASSLSGALGFHFMIGLASGLETLCGQAFGAKEYKLCGIFLQRAIVLLNLICLPICLVFWNMGTILTFIGQDPDIAAGAELYAKYLIPSVFAYAFLQPLVKFLQTQSAVTAMAGFSAITLTMHVPLCYVLVHHSGLGFRGAAVANGISQWLNVLFLVLYVKFSKFTERTWSGLSTEAFHDTWAFLKAAIPAAVMICLEYWCFELLIILSGLLPNPQLESSTLSIGMTACSLLYMLPLGLSAAVSTRVANELGANDPRAAKSSVRLTVLVGLLQGCVLAVVLLSVRRLWPRLFSSDVAVVNYVASIVPILAGEIILDGYQAVLSGVARGCGWQGIGALTNLGAYYVVGLPMALLLAFHFHFNAYGLWLGVICGVIVQCILLTCVTATLNWERLAEKAVKMVKQAEDHIQPTSTLPDYVKGS